MSGFSLSNIWDSITGAFGKNGWIEKNPTATNIIGNGLLGVGQYFAQKEANKDLMRQQRELLNLKDELQSKYSAVPKVDFGYGSLVFDDSPSLANGGILTELKKRREDKNKQM